MSIVAIEIKFTCACGFASKIMDPQVRVDLSYRYPGLRTAIQRDNVLREERIDITYRIPSPDAPYALMEKLRNELITLCD